MQIYAINIVKNLNSIKVHSEKRENSTYKSAKNFWRIQKF